ncbi:unnamed protein product [Anisakis simplex]|uniref:Nicastrin n=1 Tax=Anisakis simplex TaxID=6269 RepID=A0A0M3JSC4_ANISI|nr:unnamed protein product [Anisakis simplex]
MQLIIVVHCLVCYRIEDQIYLRLDGGDNKCFRLLNGTTQVGCQSEPDGNTGLVVYASSSLEIEQMILKMAQVTGMQYIVAVDVESLDSGIIGKLQDNRIRGVLLLSDSNSTQHYHFSEDSVCPNQKFSLYKDECEWNKKNAIVAGGFRFLDWDKPIFLIENSTEINIIKKWCFEAFNADRSDAFSPFCAARMKFFMRAAGNAPICLRRQNYFYGFADAVVELCDPLEDSNVISMIPPSSQTNMRKDTKIFVVAARMDSFSTMTDASVGDVSTLTSLISTLAVVDAVGRNFDDFQSVAIKNNRCLMFAYFHGESMGYIGSSRAVYDILQGSFPAKSDLHFGDQPLAIVNISNIDAFIEVQQLDGAGSAFFAHVDGKSYTKHRRDLVTDEALRKWNNRSISLVDPTENARLPPSSYETFLKQNRSIAGFVFAPFDSQYSYNAINSFTDRDIFIGRSEQILDEISASASAVLATVVKYLFGSATPTFTSTIDESFVSTLFDCFIVKSDWYKCELFSTILHNIRNRPEEGTKSTYISGGDNRLPSLIRLLVNAILVHSLGKEMINVTSESQCNDLNKAQQIYQYTWQMNPVRNSSACYRTPLYLTPAKSPAFEIDGHDLSKSPYSTWVESVWSSHDLVLFLVPSAYPRYDIGLFIAGCAFFVICFLIMETFCFDARQPTDHATLESDPL